ncbi:hypothetical protein BJ742DRAFT_212109 [Cladochytrium replicatum]|nr:hypothetical protein BJ742DRAFT_212109 [Cladochytrium replicatum]
MTAKLDQVKTINTAIERTVARKKCEVDTKLWRIIPSFLQARRKASVYMRPVATGMGSDAVGRVHEVYKSMKKLKSSPEPFVTVGVMSLGFLSPLLEPEWLVQWAKKKFHDLLWAEQPIESMVAFPPQSHTSGLAVALYTYRGQVSVSVCMAEDDYSLPSDRDTHSNDALFAPGTAQDIADGFDIVFKDLLQQATSLTSTNESKKERKI